MATQPIVVGVDFSECGGVALDAATQLAKDLSVELVLVHAFTPEKIAPALMGPAGSEIMKEAHLEDARSEAIELTNVWAQRARDEGVDVRTVAEDGDPKDLLMEQAAFADAALIVVGTQGHRGLKHFILGSVAEGLVRASKIPVLVVPMRGGP